jgi:hypothetical protein
MAFIQPQDLIEGDIFELLGLQNLSEEEKEDIMAKIIEGLQSRVVLRIDDLVGEEDRKKFYDLLDQSKDEEINSFLASKNINVPQITAEEALLQKNEIIQNVKAIKE